MIEDLGKLVLQLTRTAYEVEQYFIKQNGGMTQAELPIAPAGAAVAEVKNEKPPRAPYGSKKKKEEAVEDAFAPQMTEAESLAAVQDAAKAIVMRFPNVENGGKPAGFIMAKKLLAEKFKVNMIKDLNHGQRLQFAGAVKELIAAADGK